MKGNTNEGSFNLIMHRGTSLTVNLGAFDSIKNLRKAVDDAKKQRPKDVQFIVEIFENTARGLKDVGYSLLRLREGFEKPVLDKNRNPVAWAEELPNSSFHRITITGPAVLELIEAENAHDFNNRLAKFSRK